MYLKGVAILFSGLLMAGVMIASNVPEWSMNASIIEACSCPMFCQCYFNLQPAEHAGHGSDAGHFCRFNNAFRVNRGSYGDVRLDGAKFWVSGDLGSEFSDGRMDWAVLTFDKSVSQPQRDAIMQILGRLYPVQWDSFAVGSDADMQWQADKNTAEARLDGGRVAEVILKRMPGMTEQPVVIQNLRYWGAPRNQGFVLMPNEVQAYRAGNKAFEYKGTNGFMITFDISSKDMGQ